MGGGGLTHALVMTMHATNQNSQKLSDSGLRKFGEGDRLMHLPRPCN